ncbi:hypothetical protein [Neptunicella marina]|uniref:Tetratricopeptide repeat-containing protein n=1 Tax=Neptunicella marina TaxID=2125989 RepID=A0A8J6M4A0_9ALTE|nr:hypothetical protein [Neptunicella marina]MBC3767767.1 hypothetical protein [Neptunicella marina]
MKKRWLLGLAMVCQYTFAQSQNINEQQHFEQCQQEPVTCLNWIEQQLPSSVTGSLKWYSLKLLQLDALVDLQKFEQVKVQLTPLLSDPDVPPVMLASVYTYHAKLLAFDKQTEQASLYLNKAIDLLMSINSVSFNLMRFVKIANLLIYLKQHDQAMELLLKLENDFSTSPDHHFKLEVFSNITIVYQRRGQRQQQLKYAKRALDEARLYDNKHFICVSQYNVARAHQQLNQLRKAEGYFLQALTQARESKFEMGEFLALLRLAQVNIDEQDIQSAKFYFAQAESETIPPMYQSLYDSVASSIKAKS